MADSGQTRFGHTAGTLPKNLLVQPGELYASLKDVTQSADLLGAVARLPIGHAPGRLTQDTVKLEPKFEDVPIDYIYWLLRTPQYRTYCRAHATGTTNLGLPRDDFLAYPVPELTITRSSIVNALMALDDKIGLNLRMNETLEEMAQMLFKSWFVDFDPIYAKAALRSHTPNHSPRDWTVERARTYLAGMDLSIAALFPDSFEDSELGPIPVGWETSTIGREVDVVGGSTPSTKEPKFWDGDIYWATPKDLSTLSSPVLLKTERTITEAGLAKISSGLLPAGTVLLSSRAPIGYLAIAEIPVSINQGFIAMKCMGRTSNIYTWLWSKNSMSAILQNANGSTFQEISKRNFRPLPMIVASDRVLATFNEIAKPLYGRIVENERESCTLVALRDVLLPKLVSGEIRVRDTERFLSGKAS